MQTTMDGRIPDIVLRIPLPNANIDATTLATIQSSFSEENWTVALRTEDVYPCSGSWAELVIPTAIVMTTTPVVKHYVDKLLDAFDGFVKRKVTELNLSISCKPNSVSVDVPLRDRHAGRRAMLDGLFQLRVAHEQPDAKVYWLRDATRDDAGSIKFATTDSSRWTMNEIRIDSPEWKFYDWILRVEPQRELITDFELRQLRERFVKVYEFQS